MSETFARRVEPAVWDGVPHESVVTVIPGLVKPRSLGRNQRFRLVVTDRRLIFQRLNRRWFFNPSKAEEWERSLSEASPEELLRASMGSYSLKVGEVTSIRVKEFIPFTLMLSPKDAMSSGLTGLEDDIVNEVPNVIRYNRDKNMEEVEHQWTLTFEAPRAYLTYTVGYDPVPLLPSFLLDKLVD